MLHIILGLEVIIFLTSISSYTGIKRSGKIIRLKGLEGMAEAMLTAS